MTKESSKYDKKKVQLSINMDENYIHKRYILIKLSKHYQKPGNLFRVYLYCVKSETIKTGTFLSMIRVVEA